MLFINDGRVLNGWGLLSGNVRLVLRQQTIHKSQTSIANTNFKPDLHWGSNFYSVFLWINTAALVNIANFTISSKLRLSILNADLFFCMASIAKTKHVSTLKLSFL